MQTTRDGVGLRHMHVRHAPYRKALIAWCSLVLVLGVCTSYAAMRKLPLEDLARKADTIVLGTVTQQVSTWNAQYTAIYTDVTLEVERGDATANVQPTADVRSVAAGSAVVHVRNAGSASMAGTWVLWYFIID